MMLAREDLHTLAEEYGLPVAEALTAYRFVQERKAMIPYSVAKRRTMLPLDIQRGKLLVAIADPTDLEGIEEVRCITGLILCEAVASVDAIKEAIEICYRQKEEETSTFIANMVKPEGQEESPVAEEGRDLLEQVSDSPVVRLLNVVLIEAVQQGASDIHFEPSEAGIDVRYRIDGLLQLRHAPPKEYQNALITRIKVLARLDIAEQRLPQDGRIKLQIGVKEIDLRVSAVPVSHGERIVLRILDRSHIHVGLSQMGMREGLLQIFCQLITASAGIVLVTGPTGSGKTTTLYSALAHIHSAEINVMTIEDPVEYKLQGIAQIGVNPKIGLTFATGLRHILRQDPDVIMIGEIRDKETAEIAIQAALTGHLVLSTLHTNDAPSAVTRLIDMGIEPYLLSSAVVGVLAQRLVRCLCVDCKQAYVPHEQERAECHLREDEHPCAQFYRAVGCPACFDTGYKGRQGIFELMPITSAIKQQLLRSGDSFALGQIAYEEGLSSLRREGALMVARGLTSTAEVLRVTRNY